MDNNTLQNDIKEAEEIGYSDTAKAPVLSKALRPLLLRHSGSMLADTPLRDILKAWSRGHQRASAEAKW